MTVSYTESNLELNIRLLKTAFSITANNIIEQMFELENKIITEIFTVTPFPWSNEVIISQFTTLGRKGCKLAFLFFRPDSKITIKI